MSPVAETSTNKGDRTSSRPYWSRWLTASDQASSTFWKSRIAGLSADVTLGWTEAEAGAGFWAAAAQHERRKAETQATNRVIRSMNSKQDESSTNNDISWTPENGRTVAEKWKRTLKQRLQPLRLVKSDQGVFDRDPAVLAELAEGAGDGFAGGAGHRGHLFVGQQQRE